MPRRWWLPTRSGSSAPMTMTTTRAARPGPRYRLHDRLRALQSLPAPTPLLVAVHCNCRLFSHFPGPHVLVGRSGAERGLLEDLEDPAAAAGWNDRPGQAELPPAVVDGLQHLADQGHDRQQGSLRHRVRACLQLGWDRMGLGHSKDADSFWPRPACGASVSRRCSRCSNRSAA